MMTRLHAGASVVSIAKHDPAEQEQVAPALAERWFSRVAGVPEGVARG